MAVFDFNEVWFLQKILKNCNFFTVFEGGIARFCVFWATLGLLIALKSHLFAFEGFCRWFYRANIWFC